MPKKGESAKTKGKKPSRADQEIVSFFEVHKGLDKPQKLFLSAYKSTLNISESCIAAKISRQTFYNWKELGPFNEAFLELEDSIDDQMQAYWASHGRYDWRACQAWLEKRAKSSGRKADSTKPHEAKEVIINAEPMPERYKAKE